ncbi:hypothetical protein F5148DRAFT_63416 [Russula earlei]|uniref:Uncharacterized protein n=1 Tax=Russula earlei TaxID=71964 RepID=A0ACC0U9B9_9AGAM|nr:hypothetical protein F5148DRAFT_63416 [Russula earlei]
MFRENRRRPFLSSEVRCTGLDRQLSSLAQVCRSSLLDPISALVLLEIWDFPPPSQSYWDGHTETARWLDLLEPFAAVEDLRLGHDVVLHVCRALEAVAEGVGIFPALQNIFLDPPPFIRIYEPRARRPVPSFLERIVAARNLSGHFCGHPPLGSRT